MTKQQEQQARGDAQRAADITGRPIRVVRHENGEWRIDWLTGPPDSEPAGNVYYPAWQQRPVPEPAHD